MVSFLEHDRRGHAPGRGWLALGLLVGCLLSFQLRPAAAQTAPQTAPQASGSTLVVEWTEPPAGDWWVELSPLGGGAASFAEGAGGQGRIEVPATRTQRAVLCFGGEKSTTGCVELELASGMKVVLAPGDGVDLGGRFLLDEEPLGGRLTLSPLGMTLPMRFTMPLARDRDGLVRDLEIAEDGRFRIPRLGAGTYQLEAELDDGPVYRGDPVDLPSADELREALGADGPMVHDLGDILVETGATLGFLVTDTQGVPVENVLVGLSQVTPGGEVKELKGRSGAEGRARLSGVDPQLAGQSVCFKQGFLTDRRSFETPPVFVECRLEPLASVEGRLVDGDGEAIEGASGQLEGEADGARDRRSTTGASGELRFEEVSPGAHRLSVTAPGYAIERLELDLEPGEALELGEIVLRPGRELWGHVVDQANLEPVPDAVARVVSPEGAGEAVTDTEGMFRLQTDFEDPITLRVESSSHAPQDLDVGPDRLDAEDPLEIRISAGGWIEALVIEQPDGARCEGCRVSFGGAGTGTTDRDGVARSGLLAPGTYAVSIARAQSRGTLMTVSSSPEVKIARVQAEETTVVVFGDGADELEITLDVALGPDWELLTHGGAAAATWPRTQTGSFRVRRRSGQGLEVFLQRRGTGSPRVWIASIPPDFEGRRLDLDLRRLDLSGHILRAEGTAASGVVDVRSTTDPRVTASTTLDGGGAFHLPFLPPDQYRLALDGQTLSTVTVSEGMNAPVDIVLPAEEPGSY